MFFTLSFLNHSSKKLNPFRLLRITRLMLGRDKLVRLILKYCNSNRIPSTRTIQFLIVGHHHDTSWPRQGNINTSFLKIGFHFYKDVSDERYGEFLFGLPLLVDFIQHIGSIPGNIVAILSMTVANNPGIIPRLNTILIVLLASFNRRGFVPKLLNCWDNLSLGFEVATVVGFNFFLSFGWEIQILACFSFSHIFNICFDLICSFGL